MNAMPRRIRASRSAEPLSDLGPAARLARGEIVIDDKAGDPDSPNRTIRRARAYWAPRALLDAGSIDQRLYDAANRLHNSYAVGIMGARDKVTVYVDCRGAPAGIADARLAAATDYRRAAQAVGQVGMASLAWCVLSHGTVAGWAECKRWNPQKALGYLTAALERLAEHYETP